MPTWRDKFSQLITSQQQALEEVKNSKPGPQWNDATEKVKASMNDMRDFFNKYESHGSPGHDEEMPDS